MEIALVPLENGGAMTVRGEEEARTTAGQLRCPTTAALSDGPKQPAPRRRSGGERGADPGGRPAPPPRQELPTQGLNPGLLHRKQMVYRLSHQEGPQVSWTAVISN